MAVLYSDINMLTPFKKPLAENVAAIMQSVQTILGTRKGERVFNPDFGVDLEDSIFDLIIPETTLEIERKIFNAIEQYEPRVILDKGKSGVFARPDLRRYDIVLVFKVRGVVDNEMITYRGYLTSGG